MTLQSEQNRITPDHKKLTVTMNQNSTVRVSLSREDPIERIGLSTRPFNALRRAGVRTVGQLIQLLESDHVLSISNIGAKSLAEIEDCLTGVDLLDEPEAHEPDALSPDNVFNHVDAATPEVIAIPTVSSEVIKWQTYLVKKQLAMGLLHEQARVARNPIAHWLSVSEAIGRDQAYEALATVLGSSVNICEELQFLLNRVPRRAYITVLLSRYGLESKTLEQIGQEIGITRERVRQIGVKLKDKIGASVDLIVKVKSVSSLSNSPALLRIQSALHIARDMKLDITYEQWKHRICQAGLVGSWTSQDYLAIDPVEAMIAVCNLLADNSIRELRVSDNLRYAVELAASGTPGLQARVIHVRKTLPKPVKRLVKRHARFSGGVHIRWLSQEIRTELEKVKDILRGLGYRPISGNWFAPSALQGDPNRISGHDVFHHALRKMFQYCGPLSIDDVCSGVRSVVSRTTFPVPPPDVMEEILRTCGYEYEEGLYCWDGESDEDLSTSETIIMGCLGQIGPVLHHVELAQAFIDSELSFPSLHATLGRSPLFERIRTGLYKLRGMSVTRQDIERAEAAGERVPINPEVEYDKAGNVVVSATLSVIALGIGSILCAQFPNLSGKWDCYVHGERSEELRATDNEFRHLRRAFESLDCQPGDRLRFTFNTWNRTVTVERVGDEHANS